jgi:phage terminase large subunit
MHLMKTDNVIETFETCTWKKDIQCNAINSPQKISFRKSEQEYEMIFF